MGREKAKKMKKTNNGCQFLIVCGFYNSCSGIWHWRGLDNAITFSGADGTTTFLRGQLVLQRCTAKELLFQVCHPQQLPRHPCDSSLTGSPKGKDRLSE